MLPLIDMDRLPERRAAATELTASRAGATSGGTAPVPEIAVFGEWNTSNLGDRAIHAEVRRFFEENGWRARSFYLGALSPGSEQGASPGGGGAGVSAVLGGMRPPVKRALRGVWQRVRMLRLLPRLEHVQAICVGGGALLSDHNLHFPQSLVELGRYARAVDKPLLCLGCSAEGDWSARGWLMIREFLEACSVLAVRDSETASRLADTLGEAPPIIGDFCLSGAFPAVAGDYPGGRQQLAINVSQLASPWAAEQARLEDALVAVAKTAARRMAPRGIGLSIFTTGLPEDARVAKRVHARLEANGARLYLPSSVEGLSVLLGTACVVVATRLHGAILPLASGVPVAGLGVSPKLRNFFATMNIRRYCYDTASSGQLADWLALADPSDVASDQRKAIARSCVWKAREHVRARVASLAVERGAAPGWEARCT